jgi:Cdc6-like AAA superfamily ATPase
MMEAVRDPAKHILLYGERGLEKTSISNNFWTSHRTNDQMILAARVQAYPLDDFSSLWLRVLEEFGTVSRNFHEEIRADFEHVTPDTVRREFQKLNHNLMPLIIIDEFDQLRRTDARELTANLLKSLHDCAVNVTILLIGVADNVEELIADHQSLRRVLSLVKLERMSAVDLNEILDRRLRLTPLSLDDDARSAVVGLSCGVPYYVQTLGKFAAQNAILGQRLRVCIEDVNAAIEKFIVESGESFAEAYQKATESRQTGNIFQEMILSSALARADPSGFFRPSEVVKILNVIRFRQPPSLTLLF